MRSTSRGHGRLHQSSANLELESSRGPGLAAMTHPVRLTTAAAQGDQIPDVVNLDAPLARRADLVGAKASALARARVAGIPVLPGFAVTTAFTRSRLEGLTSWHRDEALHDEWRCFVRLRSAGARRAFVVDRRGRRVAVDGGPLHFSARRARLGALPGRRRRGRPIRRRRSHGGPRPAVPRTGMGRRAVRRRSRDRPHRPPRGRRCAWRAGPPRQRSGRRRAHDAVDAWPGAGSQPRHPQCAAGTADRPPAGEPRPSCLGHLRGGPGHRVGHRGRRPCRHAAESSDHRRWRRGTRKWPGARSRPGRRDVRPTAGSTGGGPLGDAAAPRHTGGTEARGRHSGAAAAGVTDRRHGRRSSRGRSGPSGPDDPPPLGLVPPRPAASRRGG